MQRKDRFEGTRGLLFKALEASSQDDGQCDRKNLPPVKNEVCAALRIILEEALIVDGKVLSTDSRRKVATVMVRNRRVFDGDERFK